MKLSLLSPFSLILITKIFYFLLAATTPQATDNDYYTECNKPYICGSIKEIKYPFWGNDRPSYCGLQGYEVLCQESTTQLNFIMSSQSFVVADIDSSKSTMTIVRKDLLNGLCTPNPMDTVINPTLVDFGLSVENLTLLYSCRSGISSIVGKKENLVCGDNKDVIYFDLFLNSTVLSEASRLCGGNLTVPVMRENLNVFEKGTLKLQDWVKKGFEVSYEMQVNMTKCNNCEESGGICGTNNSTHEFTCFCKDGPRDYSCPPFPEWNETDCSSCKRSGGRCGFDNEEFICYCSDKPHAQTCNYGNKVGLYIGIAFAAVGGFLLLAGLVFIVVRYRKKKSKHIGSSWKSRDISFHGSSILDLERSSSFYGVQVFEYDDLQEATNNFDEKKELGDGGFGVVYQGKLRDGRVVAVKRLYERNFKRVEQFKNEVDILARLRHRNLVTLYGCTSRSSRELLLVYEYVCNGTVADHLHGERAKPGSPPWTTRMSIAVETASALSFLHNSDVIHRDVKTSNILLDENFGVKVADFGLSRLYPNNVTHVSTAPQGTPGYVDPEYHECYRLTDKSDVYSFGVVLIELISSMPAVDITRHRHDINLSYMAIEKIQNHALNEIVDPYLGFESNLKVRRMINGVAELAFRCLQGGRDIRPSMQEVLDILKEISSDEYSSNEMEEMEINSGGNELLKSDPPTVSSSSTSNNTTPNQSK